MKRQGSHLCATLIADGTTGKSIGVGLAASITLDSGVVISFCQGRAGTEFVLAETIYDVALIGSGPAGYTAGNRGGQPGLKVALIESANVLKRKTAIVNKYTRGLEFLMKNDKVAIGS